MAYEIFLNSLGFAITNVNIRLHHSQTMIPLPYKVDSDARRTTISREALEKLGYDENWIRQGKKLDDAELGDCYEVILPEIQIGSWVGFNWPFITSLSAPFKFLLGTDSMRFFNWTFDYEQGICSFELIKNNRNAPIIQSQSIHPIDPINNYPNEEFREYMSAINSHDFSQIEELMHETATFCYSGVMKSNINAAKTFHENFWNTVVDSKWWATDITIIYQGPSCRIYTYQYNYSGYVNGEYVEGDGRTTSIFIQGRLLHEHSSSVIPNHDD